jgi:hypothetical protein
MFVETAGIVTYIVQQFIAVLVIFSSIRGCYGDNAIHKQNYNFGQTLFISAHYSYANSNNQY